MAGSSISDPGGVGSLDLDRRDLDRDGLDLDRDRDGLEPDLDLDTAVGGGRLSAALISLFLGDGVTLAPAPVFSSASFNASSSR